MLINWRFTAPAIIAAVALGAVLVISFACASGGNGEAKYEVTVQFNTEVSQDDIDEADALLRTFDDDVEFLIMEMFPPTGRAVLATDAPDFCQTVTAELEAKSYVDNSSCRPWQEPDQADPDAPVSTDNEANS